MKSEFLGKISKIYDAGTDRLIPITMAYFGWKMCMGLNYPRRHDFGRQVRLQIYSTSLSVMTIS